MNLILVSESDFIGSDLVRLQGRRFTHIRDIHRASPGEQLRVGRVGGPIGLGEIVTLSSDSVEMRVSLSEAPPEKLDLTLVLALPRPKVLKRTLQMVTTLGIKRVVLMNAYRVEKAFWHCEQIQEDQIRMACLLGLEQARDTVFPEIRLERRFKPFVEDTLPTMALNTLGFIAHPLASTECPRAVAKATTLAVGPEGGFIDYEVKLLEKAGLTTVHLTPRILKVETAISYLVGRLF